MFFFQVFETLLFSSVLNTFVYNYQPFSSKRKMVMGIEKWSGLRFGALIHVLSNTYNIHSKVIMLKNRKSNEDWRRFDDCQKIKNLIQNSENISNKVKNFQTLNEIELTLK